MSKQDNTLVIKVNNYYKIDTNNSLLYTGKEDYNYDYCNETTG